MTWQDILTAPKDGTWILTWTRGIQKVDSPFLVVRWGGHDWVDADVGSFYDPTYWKPLEPPDDL